MPSIQGAQTHQVPAHMNNDLRSTTGAVSQSSYVSSSGIKSVLLNAWNTVKSAVSGMLSSFGLHISGEQGSDKPGREIAMDIFPRPASPLPVDVQFENDIYESSGGNIYDSVYAHTVSGRLSLTGALYSEIEEPLYEEIGSNQAQTPPPVNLSTHPSLLRLSGSEIEEPLYEEIGSDQAQTPPPVNLSTHPSLSRLPGSTPQNNPLEESDYDEIIFDNIERNPVKTEQELKSSSLPPIPADDDESNYEPISLDTAPQGTSELKDESTGEVVYATVNKHSPLSEAEKANINLWEGISDGCESKVPTVPERIKGTPLYTQTPENDPRRESDYADPKDLSFNKEQLLQRVINERLKMQ
ncbi:TPA: hypothetical protein ACXHWU_001920 [Morganella morganii]